MPDMDEENKMQDPPSNRSASGQEEDAGSNNNINIWKPVIQMKDWNSQAMATGGYGEIQNMYHVPSWISKNVCWILTFHETDIKKQILLQG